MPSIPAFAGSRILQRLELKTMGRDAHFGAVVEQPLFVGRDEMRHAPAFPHVAVQPETAIHRVNHAVAAPFKFSKRR